MIGRCNKWHPILNDFRIYGQEKQHSFNFRLYGFLWPSSLWSPGDRLLRGPIPNAPDFLTGAVMMELPAKPHSKGSPASRAVVTGNDLDAEATSKQFGDSPVQTACPHCHEAITTTVRFKKSCVGVLSCIFSILFLGWLGICVGPFLWLALRVRMPLYVSDTNTFREAHNSHMEI